MLFEDWLDEKGMTKAEAGRRLGLRSRASVGRIIRERGAEPKVVRGIFELTNGAVTPNDVFALPVPQAMEAAE